jgi:nucleotide-binding universal stress UspA family protein
MKNLLAILRDTDQAESYVKYLKEMGQNLSADVHLLYIENRSDYPLVAPDVTGVVTAKMQLSMKRRIRQASEKLGKLVRETNASADRGIIMDFSTEIGETLTVLDDYISARSDCMVVLKNQEDSSLWDWTDNDMKVIRHVKCPVWLIPGDTDFQTYDEIVYATDYHEEDLTTMQKLVRLTSRFSPNITALHITTDDGFMTRVERAGFQEMIRGKTSYDRIKVKVLQESASNDMGLLVNDFSTLVGAKLIVVLKENKHFLERIFNPDTSRKIIRQAKIPVLVFHEPE